MVPTFIASLVVKECIGVGLGWLWCCFINICFELLGSFRLNVDVFGLQFEIFDVLSASPWPSFIAWRVDHVRPRLTGHFLTFASLARWRKQFGGLVLRDGLSECWALRSLRASSRILAVDIDSEAKVWLRAWCLTRLTMEKRRLDRDLRVHELRVLGVPPVDKLTIDFPEACLGDFGYIKSWVDCWLLL